MWSPSKNTIRKKQFLILWVKWLNLEEANLSRGLPLCIKNWLENSWVTERSVISRGLYFLWKNWRCRPHFISQNRCMFLSPPLRNWEWRKAQQCFVYILLLPALFLFPLCARTLSPTSLVSFSELTCIIKYTL